MIRFLYIIIFQFIFLFSCSNTQVKEKDAIIIQNKFAENFVIKKIKNGYIIHIVDNKNVSSKFLLTTNPEKYKNLNYQIIKIPVNNVVCFSSTHCAFIDILNQNKSIKGISGLKNIYNKELNKKIDSNKIYEIGNENNIDYEKILSIKPDVIFAYSIDHSSMAAFQKFSKLNIPVIFINEYSESELLGRTEWLKVFASFYNKLDYANYYCDSVFNNYSQLKYKISDKQLKKPIVLSSMPWKGVWWAPGGNSYFAKLISDAGGKYIFKNNSSKTSIPFSIEEVFANTKNVDIWLNTNMFDNKNDMLKVDDRLKNFQAFNYSQIYNNINRVNKAGGNDFWESGVVHPDIILKDLIKIMHPEIEINHKLYYYRKVN